MVNVQEVVFAALLHDIGKLLQRAHPSDELLPPAVRARQSVILPTTRDGRATHWHALWSDAFFQWVEDEGLPLPARVNAHAVRDLAVFHHRPTNGASTLITEADRLASGQDRKPRDEDAEADPAKRRAFREKSLLALAAAVDLGLGRAGPAFHPAVPLDGRAIFPERAEPATQPERYAALFARFQEGFRALCREFSEAPALFEQGLLGLSEQLLWAVPSSTIDQPDVPLHDHAGAVAAIAAALFLYHAARGELEDEAAIRDRTRPKFRLLEGDLSGIQASLFRLKSEQVKGVSRILRARSFLIAATTEAAALLCRDELGLPASSVLVAAGGRFRLLLPNVEGATERVAAIQARLDRWMAARWAGDLAVVLGLTEPFAPALLDRGRVFELEAIARAAIDRAKLAPLSYRVRDPVLRAPGFSADGACASCGARPATETDRYDPTIRRCLVCDEAHAIGAALPHARGYRLDRADRLPGGSFARLFDAYELRMPHEGEPLLPHGSDRAQVALAAAFPEERAEAAPLRRFVATYVPRLERPDDARYAALSEQARMIGVGELKTFEHLACEAREVLADGRLTGRAMLGVVKADVDRLGFVFSHGLGEDPTPARIATLSRMLDGFFAGYLPTLLRESFANTYTVYAGGDDLLLIAPWLEAIRLAVRLRAEFDRFSNHSPSLTLSAAIAFIHPNEPLNRAAREAERRLESAKEAGRDRVSLITDEPIPWPLLEVALADAERLNELIRAERLPVTSLHSLLGFWADKEATEKGRDARRAIWLSRYAYYRSRFAKRHDDEADRTAFLDRLMGLGAERAAPAPIPISIALWRNR